MILRSALWVFLVASLSLRAAEQGAIPIAGITAQKPQSKLWWDQGTWWAALPQDNGVWLWRYADGAFEPQKAPGPLKGTGAASQCDVVLHGKTLFVLAFQKGAKEVPLHALAFSEGAYRELPGYPVALEYPGGALTMACDVDSKGVLWVACVDGKAEAAVQSLAEDMARRCAVRRSVRRAATCWLKHP